MAKMFFGLISLFTLSSVSSYRIEGCEVDLKPARNFNMNSMTGLWYVIEKTGDNPNCLTYNITKSSTPGEYNLEINSIIMSFFGFKSNKKENGIIITDSEKYSASIIIKDSGDVKNKLTVFMTDYSNYAGLYSCNKWFFSYINEAIILSRTPTLYKVYLEQVRSRLSKIDVSPNTVSQRNCPNRGCHGHFRYC